MSPMDYILDDYGLAKRIVERLGTAPSGNERRIEWIVEEIRLHRASEWRREAVRKQIEELGKGNPCRARTAND